MNIDQARQIEMRRLVEHFGGRYHKQTKPDEVWYYSPFRPEEHTASFKVNPHRNNWYDFARGAGGSTIDLWIDYNNQDRKSRDAIKAALQGLGQFSSHPSSLLQQYKSTADDYNRQQIVMKPVQVSRFKLLKPPGRIWHNALLEEIGRRRLSIATVSPFIKQASILDTKTKNRLTGFAFQNDADGWEISIPNPRTGKSFKTSIGRKAPTSFINNAHEEALVFEGFWDYLTWVKMQKTSDLKVDVHIMNSLSFKKKISESIIEKKQIKKVLLFLDNDEAGLNATNDLISYLETSVSKIGTKNLLYKYNKDLNEAWISARLSL